MASALPSLAPRLIGLTAALASLTGCDGQRERPPRAEPAHAATTLPPAPEAPATPAAPAASSAPATASASAPATASATASAPATASATASASTSSNQPAASVPCFCMSWVHRDENGEYCYPTRAACDESFRTFGRHDKLPCRAAMQPRCERIACRGGGAQCFRLP